MDLSQYKETTTPPDELAAADEVYGALADSVRRLAVAQLLTTVDFDEARAVAAELDALTSRLQASAKAGSLGVELTAGLDVRNHGNAVIGLRNPFAAALGEHRIVWSDTGAGASVHLNGLYEGPPGHVHGGVLALLLDQLFGEAAAATGVPGMTARLTLNYRRPTPLGDATMMAWLDHREGIKTTIKGHFKDAEGNITVEADGLFITPRWARAGQDAWPSAHPSTFE